MWVVWNRLRIGLLGFSPVLFGQPALLLCFFGAVLLSLDAVPLDFAADGAFVAVELFGDFGDGAVAGQVLDMVSFVLGQLCVAHGNLSCRTGRMLPHTGLFLLWKVALQMRIRPVPKYPVYFLENGEKGQAILGVRALNNHSNMVRIIEISGYHRLDNAALPALKNILIYLKI
ncbi:DEAD/DEAH box helicase [Morococcus cerebrosus]|uniref:DEAD/DEAH box helicase n=2 Tax=Morococcus cerebrosus TaxID=1056807 RepID=A0A0C1GXH6_9NEIS|nr:DEAD/DEAH box helicase [Morococcus cerebrosus]